MNSVIEACVKGDVDDAAGRLEALVKLGYSGMDIVGTLFKVVKSNPNLQEYQKLEFIRVSP